MKKVEKKAAKQVHEAKKAAKIEVRVAMKHVSKGGKKTAATLKKRIAVSETCVREGAVCWRVGVRLGVAMRVGTSGMGV